MYNQCEKTHVIAAFDLPPNMNIYVDLYASMQGVLTKVEKNRSRKMNKISNLIQIYKTQFYCAHSLIINFNFLQQMHECPININFIYTEKKIRIYSNECIPRFYITTSQPRWPKWTIPYL